MATDRLGWRIDRLEERDTETRTLINDLRLEIAKAKGAAYGAKDACENVESDQQVLIERMGNMIDAYKAQRNALYSAAGALALLAAGIILRSMGIVG